MPLNFSKNIPEKMAALATIRPPTFRPRNDGPTVTEHLTIARLAPPHLAIAPHFRLPRPATQERGEGRGEGNLLNIPARIIVLKKQPMFVHGGKEK